MDYMTLKEASEKWGVTPADQLFVCRWAYPRRCEDSYRQTVVSKIQKNNPLVRFL